MLFIKHVLCTACTPCISMNNNFCGKEKNQELSTQRNLD